MTNEYSQATLDKMQLELLNARLASSLRNNKSALSTCEYKYGLAQRDLLLMLQKQDFNCAICGATFEDRRWVIDHCHRTKQVRGLLCSPCNTWLGKFESMIRSAAHYLDMR